MKNLFLIQAAFLISTSALMAQVPMSFNYQAVARDNAGLALADQAVSLRISITEGPSGPADYVETHSKTTSATGLFTLPIGGGSVVSGTFAQINWATANKFLKVEMDPAGGSSYQLIGTTQLLSVPYALNAGNGLANGTATNQLMYWTGNAWAVLEPGSNNQVLTICNGALTWATGGVCPTPTYPVGTVHCSGTPTAVVDVTNPITGKTWMDRNLGASRAATSSNDTEAFGDLYQWGRGADGHQCRNSATTTVLSSTDQPGHGYFIRTVQNNQYDWRSPQNDNLWQGVNGINNPCPIGYRLPTSTELDEERLSWSSNNAAGAFASPLKLTLGGNRNHYNAGVDFLLSTGTLSSSTISGDDDSYVLGFGSTIARILTFYRSYGIQVRCVKD